VTDRIRRIDHPAAGGARNMAVDEALMDVARDGGVALRFYRWDPPCLSLGRNQAARGRYDLDAADRRGIEVVRRPTGGRAVLHDRELTYSVVAPSGLWGGLRESYRRINRALLRGLAGLGAEVGAAEPGPEGRAPGPGRRACFRDPLPGEIVAAGRKLVGSAQWRRDGALLQHGSLLLHDDQGTVDELRSDGPSAPPGAGDDGEGGSPAAALSDVLPELPDPGRLADALARGFAGEFGLDVSGSSLTDRERERAAGLEPRYRDGEWTWRR
jgi:lipoate-protein ligase A